MRDLPFPKLRLRLFIPKRRQSMDPSADFQSGSANYTTQTRFVKVVNYRKTLSKRKRMLTFIISPVICIGYNVTFEIDVRPTPHVKIFKKKYIEKRKIIYMGLSTETFIDSL